MHGTVRRSFTPVRTFAAVIARLGLVATLAVACGTPPPPPVSGVSHVVLITIDTLRADATTPYGAPSGATPHLEAFARASVQFDRAFTVMPTTGPAHLAMLTGRYPQQVGALQNGVAARPGTRSLPALMRASGRRTAAFVSVHHLSRETLKLDGFDVWDAPEQVRDGADTVAAAEAWLEDQDGAPLFLWVHLFDPHQPYRAHADVPPAIAEALAPLAAVEAPNRGGFAVADVTPEQRAKLELLYRADVHYADRQTGRLLAALDRLGLGRRAAIAITSDHGEVLGEALADYRYGFDHGEFLLPMEMRVPLWVRLPDGRHGGRVELTVETRALFGTLAAAAALTLPDAPTLPGIRRGTLDRRADAAAFAVRRSFQAKELPAVLRGTRHAIASDGTLLVASEWDATTRVDVWTCNEAYPTRLDASSLAASVLDRRTKALDAWTASMASESGAAGPDDATRERLRALGYLD